MRRILYSRSPGSFTNLAEACLSLTPHVSLIQERSLYLDIASTSKLFGGEMRLLSKFEDQALTFNLPPLWVLTDRPEWAACLFQSGESVFLSPGEGQRALLRLPIDRLVWCGDPLRIEEERGEREELLAFIKKIGLRFIGEFLRLPPSSILKRFGKLGGELQAWAGGKRELCLPTFEPQTNISEKVDAEDLGSVESLLFIMRTSLVRMERRLRGRGLLAKRLRLGFHLESKRTLTQHLDILEPTQEAQNLLRLLREFLTRFEWDAPLQTLELEITDTLPYRPGQLSLFDNSENRSYDLSLYINRLQMRFGEKAVGYAGTTGSFFPERSLHSVWPAPSGAAFPFPQRPPLLFLPVQPLAPPLVRSWRLIPAEKIESEWWEEKGAERDYFMAETQQGETLWIYWERVSRRWFMQGSFE